MWLSLLEGADVTVDGARHSRTDISWTIQGETYTSRSWRRERAPLGLRGAGTVDRSRAGGLEPGLASVQVAVVYRMSYIPAEMQPTTSIARRGLTLVTA